jgi:very-short-patch-repair endonuclease
MVRRLASTVTRKNAKSLRANPPNSEKTLWKLIRASQLGLKFRRRSVVLGWIPDFWCPSAKLALEIDASTDNRKRQRDAVRDAALESYGIRTLHIKAADIFRSPDDVKARILAAAAAQNSDAGEL